MDFRLAGIGRGIVIAAASVVPPGVSHAAATNAQQGECKITSSGIGPLSLGMTVKEAKTAFPQATFNVADSAEDTVALEARSGKEQVLLSQVGDKLPAGKTLPDTTKLKSLETYSEKCRDENGIGPGTLLDDAVARLGGVKEIVMSEVESRQYVTFQQHPKGRWYRIDNSGVFAEGSPRRTTQYTAKARILGVGVDANQ